LVRQHLQFAADHLDGAFWQGDRQRVELFADAAVREQTVDRHQRGDAGKQRQQREERNRAGIGQMRSSATPR
jgi:hypothetical protein